MTNHSVPLCSNTPFMKLLYLHSLAYNYNSMNKILKQYSDQLSRDILLKLLEKTHLIM